MCTSSCYISSWYHFHFYKPGEKFQQVGIPYTPALILLLISALGECWVWNFFSVRYSSWSAKIDLCRQTTWGWANTEWLQHPERINPSSCASSQRWSQEKKEEELHHTKEDQAQEEEGMLFELLLKWCLQDT